MPISHCCKKQFVLEYILFFVVFVGFTFFAKTAMAVEYGGIGGRPAYPRPDNPRTESIFMHTLNPGATKEEGVLLINNSSERKTLSVYAVDSLVSSGGAFACRQLSESKRGVGAWISLFKKEVTLNPGANEIVPFVISVPFNAGVGEHNGCIEIQEKKEKTEGESGMMLTFRTGLRVAITIPGEIIKKLEVIGFKIELQEDGRFLLKPSVKNLGNVSLDSDVRVTTNNFLGSIYAQNGGRFPILRDETSDWNFELKKPFWGGWYRSSFVVGYMGDTKIQLQGPSIWFFSSPKPLALAIEISVLLLVVFSIFQVWLSKKRKKWIRENWVEYEVASGENIQVIAEKFDVSWKLLARVNKLKPPYSIKSGGKIKVPPKS